MGTKEDVVIVGGGPAGANCAYELASRGLKPLILDHSHPREKPCGGGITPAVPKRFPWVENLRSKGRTFGDFKVLSCVDFEVVSKELADGFCISRGIFDQEILNMAIQQGARHIKEQAIDVQKKSDGWSIKTAQNEYLTKIVVGADGVNSIVRRRIVGAISPQNLGLAFGYITKSPKSPQATLKFLGEIPGYIWIFPGKNYLNVGIGSELKFGSQLKAILDTFISVRCPDLEIQSCYSALLPSANEPDFFDLPCAGVDWLLVGDAAGHVDPISGEGILYALWGGMLAAQAIHAHDPQMYDSLWRREYGSMLRGNCENKADFFDPLKSTLRLMSSLAGTALFWSH